VKKYKPDRDMKAAPHMMLHIQPRRNKKAVINCNKATQEFTSTTRHLECSLRRVREQHSTEIPEMNVPVKYLKENQKRTFCRSDTNTTMKSLKLLINL